MPSSYVQTPGGLALPSGVSLGDAIPSIAGRETVAILDAGGVEIAPWSGSEGIQPAGGPVVSYQEVVEGQPIVGSVINKIVRNGVRVPIVVSKRKDDGSIEDVDRDHDLVKLINAPAPGRGQRALKEWMLRPPLTNGWGVLAKFRGNGPNRPPTQLFPCNGRYMNAYRLRGGFIDLWTTVETGRTVGLPSSEVVHIAWSADGTAEGENGVSPIKQLGDAVRVDDAARRFAYATLVNAARPGGAFVLPPNVILDEELKRALRTVIDVWTGVDAAGGTPIIAGGAKWDRFDSTAVEAELVETRRRSLEEVCIAYDVSPIAIGDLKYATQRGNVAELNQDFFGNTLGPWFSLLADTLNTQLIEPEREWREQGLFVRFDASEFLRGDPLAWSESLEVRVRSGGLTLNERRKLDGQAPFKNPMADVPLVAGGGQALAPLPDAPAAADPAKTIEAAAPSDGAMVALYPASAAPSDGAMVALYPASADADRLALDGGELADQLHVTLAFLGAAADIDASTRMLLLQTVHDWAAGLAPMAGEISGVGLFTAGPEPVTYLSVDLPDLPAAREDLVNRLARIGVPASATHGFTPHMTLAYADRVTDAAQLELGSIRFDAVTVAIADHLLPAPFGAGATDSTEET